MISRRSFLVRAVLAGAVTLALSSCRDAPDKYHAEVSAELDATALAVKGYDASHLAGKEDPAALRQRLVAQLATGYEPGKPLADAVGRVVSKDYEDDRTVEVGGWVMSRTEADLIAYAALLHAKAGTTAAAERHSVDSAQEAQFVTIKNWGPNLSCAGQGFNVQSDGHSSLWVGLDGEPPQGLSVLLNGVQVPTTQVGALMTTRLDGADFDNLFGKAGDILVQVYDPNQGLKQTVGTFTVAEGGEFATTLAGKPSTVFREVSNWGPRATPALTPFNVQADESSAFWIGTACAPGRAIVRLGDTELTTTVGSGTISAKLSGLEAIKSPGKLPLTLFDPVTKESILVGEFEVGAK